MKFQKQLILLFSALVYVLAWGAIIYYLDFFVGYYVPKTIEQGHVWSWEYAIVWDLILLVGTGLIFEFARKKAFFASLDEGLQRSVQVLIYVSGLLLLIVLWRPINIVLYDFRDHALASLFTGGYYWGWWMCLTASLLLDHWSQFGLRQSWGRLSDRREAKATAFNTTSLYLLVRHPVYLGIMIFHFSTPYFTLGRLLLAVGVCIFLLRKIELDEVDLLKKFGDNYRVYQQKVPKVFPWQKVAKQRYRGDQKMFSSIEDLPEV